MDPARIQADTMGFADRFVTEMTAVYDGLERRATTPAAKDAAHQLKTDLALGSIGNAVNPRPVAGMMDLVVFVSLLRRIAEDPWAARTFGPSDASLLVEALKRQEADVRSLASQYLTDPQLAELTELVSEWHRLHPDDHAVSHFHLADLPEANLAPSKRGAIGASVFALLFFDPTAHLDPTVREIELSRATSERMFFYVQRLPLLVQLQVEGFYRHLLETPELQRAASDASAVAGSTTRFTETSARFTEVVSRFPGQLSEERRQAVRQMSVELTGQREAAVRQLAAAVARERDAAITQATTRFADERQQAIRQTAEAVREEQRAFVANLEATADRTTGRLLARAALWGLALSVAIGVVVFAIRFPAVRRDRGALGRDGYDNPRMRLGR
jgi:hypothetical protein